MKAAFIPTYNVSSSERGLNGDSNPDLCDARAVLNQLSMRPSGSWLLCGFMMSSQLMDTDLYKYMKLIHKIHVENQAFLHAA